MTIKLKPEQEQIIREEIENGHFHSADEVIDHALAALKEKGRKRVGGPKQNLAQFLLESPLAGAELNLKRQQDYPRPVKP